MAAPANPVSGGAQEYKILSSNRADETIIIADDQNLKSGTLLSKNATGEVKALTNGEICIGVSKELTSVDTNTYDVKALVRLVDERDLYYFELKASTTIDDDDIGKFYGVDANHDIDGDTADTVPDVSRQFQLVEVKADDAGVFRIVSNSLASKTVLSRKTTITTAQVLALNTTPISLVPAPGAGKYTVVDKIVATVDYATTAYTTNTTLEFRYTDGSGTKVTADIAALLTATADKAVSVGGIEAALVLTTNAAVVAYVPTGNAAAGDSDIEVTVYYRTIEL